MQAKEASAQKSTEKLSSTFELDNNSNLNRSRPGKQVNLTEQEVRGLCIKARDIFINQPILLELEAPIKICGRKRIVPY